ncbi:MAG TPA: DUF2141 domain-containing protein [Allosphingosinicella sp.]
MFANGVMPLTKFLPPIALGVLALAAPASPAEAAIGPDAGACRAASGRPAILVNVTGFKARSGRVRVQVYASPADFLEKGRKLRRIDVPISGSGAMPVCVAVPGPGRYAVAVRHDVNGNNRSGDWSDGGGFSRNPHLSLTNLKPRYRDVVISVGDGVTPTQVILNYKKGLSIGPARS